MNLENFPTNDTAKRMMQTVSQGWYDNSYIGKWLFQVMGTELEEARHLYEELVQQAFPETATWGLVYHEQKYGLIPNENDTIDDRRQRILLYRDVQVPLNPERFSKILSDLTGADVRINEIEKSYIFSVVFSGKDVSNTADLYKHIRKMKPSHLSFIPGFQFDINNKNIIDVVSSRHRLFTDWWERVGITLDGAWPLNGVWALGGIYVHPVKSKNRMHVNTEMNNQVSVIIKKNYWFLNGEYSLDGQKELSSNISQEVL